MFRRFLAYLSVFLLVFTQLVLTAPVFSADVNVAIAAPAQSTTAAQSIPLVITTGSNTKTSDLIVPKGETVIIDFSKSAQFNASGNVQNSGTIYGISANPQITNVAISANNILNNSGALLTTILPGSSIQGLPYNIAQLVNNLNFTLTAVNNVVNSGVISSAGNLSINAGGSIVNTAAVTNIVNNASSQAALISAVNNLNFSAPNIINSGTIASQLGTVTAATAQMTNSGIMQALQGNINIQNLIGNTLNINNSLGTIAAQNVLNISALNNSASSALSELVLRGGTLVGSQVIFSGGKMSVSVDDIRGPVYASGCSAVIDSVGKLNIANLKLSGDPLIASGGDLDLSGLFASGPLFATYGGDFIALAGGDITATSAPQGATINAQAQTGPGGQILLSAGTDFSVFNPSATKFLEGRDFTINGASQSGGSIKLANVSLQTNNSPVTVNAYGGIYSQETVATRETPGPGSIQIGDILVCCNKGQTPPITPVPDSLLESTAANVSLTSSGLTSAGNITNVCGDITISAGDFKLLPGANLQAFNGGVIIDSKQLINLEGSNKVTSVGGNVQLGASEGINVGQGTYLGAFSSESVPSVSLYMRSGGDIVSQGNNTFVADKGTIDIATTGTYSSIRTGSRDSFLTCGGDLSLNAEGYYGYSSLSLGSENTITSKGGSINLYARGPLTVGSDTTINAFLKPTQYGGIYLGSNSNTTIGDRVKMNSVGGYLNVWGRNLYTGEKDSFRTFSGAKQDGKWTPWLELGSSGYTSIGDSNYLEGNQIEIYASNTLQTGSNLVVKALEDYPGSGNIYLYGWSGGINTGESNKFIAQKDINLYTYRWINTGRDNEFSTCNGSIYLQSHPYNYWYYWYGSGGVNIGENNKFNARGGDISVSVSPYYYWYYWYYPDDINIGRGSVFNAEQRNGVGGSVSFSTDSYGTIASADSGDRSEHRGPALTVNANGGDASFLAGTISLGSKNVVNAFASGCGSDEDAVSTSLRGGNVILTASNGALTTGSHNSFNAVGGNITLYGSSIALGPNNTLNAFNHSRAESCCSSNSAGNITLTAPYTISVGEDGRFNAVGGNISIASQYDTIDLGSGTRIYTFTPERGAGNVSLNTYSTLTLEDITIAANRDVSIASAYGGVTLTGVTIAAGTDKSGGDLSISAGKSAEGSGEGTGSIWLTHNNRLFAYNDVNFTAARDILVGGGYNNCICSIKGDINFDAGRNIEFGRNNNKLQTNEGGINLYAGRDISMGSSNLLAAGGGDIRIQSTDGDINLGRNNTFNAFYRLHVPRGAPDYDNHHRVVGGNIIIIAREGELDMGSGNSLNAVGGTITLRGHPIEEGRDNRLCVFPNVGDEERNAIRPMCPSCVPPERPHCKAPVIEKCPPIAPRPPRIECCIKPSKPPVPPPCPKPPVPPICPKPPVPPPPGPTQTVNTAETPATPAPVAAPALPLSVKLPAFSYVQQQYFWMVTYSSPSYLEQTAGKRVIVVDGHFASNDPNDTSLIVGGAPVRISAMDKALKRSDFIFRKANEGEEAGIVALSNASDDTLFVTINKDSYRLLRGSLLMLSSTRTSDGSTRISRAQVLNQMPNAPDEIPRSVLLPTREIYLYPELKYSERQSEKTASTAAPIAFVEPIAEAQTAMPSGFYARSAELNPLSKGVYELRRGTILAFTAGPTQIKTTHCSVYAGKDAVIMVTTSPRITRVRDLTDQRLDSVKVLVGGKYATVSPGTEMDVSTLAGDIMPVVLEDGMGRRNVNRVACESAQIVSSQFSLVNALMNHPSLLDLRRASDRTSHVMLERIMKTAAALHMLTDRYAGPYFAKPAGRAATGVADRPGSEPM